MAIKIFGFKDKEKRLNGKEVFFKYSNAEQFTGSYWIDGKKIYEKTINIGALPNNNVKTVSHGINQIDRLLMSLVLQVHHLRHCQFQMLTHGA